MPSVPNSGSYVTDFIRDSEIWYLPVWKDRNGNVLQTPAKGAYPKPQVEPVSIGVIKATVRNANYTDSDYKTQLNAVNSGSWRNWSAGQAWIAHIRTQEVNEGQTDYTLIRYIVLCSEYGWKALAPQIGYYYLNSGTETCFTDLAGTAYIGNIDNAGGKLAAASNLIIKEWDIKREISFSALGF